MESETALGPQFRRDDLFSLVEDGHELATHTYSHVESQSVSSADFIREVQRGRLELQQMPGLVVSDNFAYPHSIATLAVKRLIGKCMRSCRAGGNFSGINRGNADLNLLRANPLYGNRERLGSVRHLLRMNQELGGWLIFYTHDVQTSSSPYGCTKELLESVVTLALDASMRILTINEVISLATTQDRACRKRQ